MAKVKPLKIVVFGSGGVGKSSITLRFVTDTFSPEYLPTIEDCYRKHCIVDDRAAFLDILDTAGQEEYSALRDQWVREGRAFLLVYSINNRASFDEISQFRERILLVTDSPNVPMVLVGNKCDLTSERVISAESGAALAKEFGGVPFFECSALTAVNCDKIFEVSVREIRKQEEQEAKARERQLRKEKSFWEWCSIL